MQPHIESTDTINLSKAKYKREANPLKMLLIEQSKKNGPVMLSRRPHVF